MTDSSTLTTAELDEISQSFESRHPIDVIRWAAERFSTGLVATVRDRMAVSEHALQDFRLESGAAVPWCPEPVAWW